MLALRVCVGTVSNEQRSSNGSSAIAELLSAGAATKAAAAATNLRRDIDPLMLFLLVSRWSRACAGAKRAFRPAEHPQRMSVGSDCGGRLLVRPSGPESASSAAVTP